MKFKLNLIREIKAEQEARQRRRRAAAWLFFCSYTILAVIFVYGATDLLRMHRMVKEERGRLNAIKAEYQQYKATSEIVSKADVELLDRLQNNRIFWTKKLLVMASHLPENYWITDFGYDGSQLMVNGYGYISDRQEQLLTLHDYLDGLRKEPTFSDVFKPVYLNSTIRDDEKERGRKRVSFSYTGMGGK
jgi:Tfp pilus assembly protein PilN